MQLRCSNTLLVINMERVIPFISKRKEKTKLNVDYLSLSVKDKAKMVLRFSLKAGGPIILISIALLFILDYFYSDELTGTTFFALALMGLPGVLLFIGGCLGGLSRYNIPPKMRIVEPDDQAVTPSDFQIRVRYDPKIVNSSTIRLAINDQTIPSKLSKEFSIVSVPRVFKTPPKKAISILIYAYAQTIDGKDLQDKIRIICDPESDEEDYNDYWEFKREDDTYWGKEMEAAQKHSRRTLIAFYFMGLAVLLLIFNAIFGLIYWNFISPLIV